MAGSLISRQADAYNVSLPMQIPLLLGYIVAETVAFTGPDLLSRVLAYMPPTAPVIDPALYAAGGMTAWQLALSMGLCVGGTVLVGRLAAVVYARSILMTGARVRIRQALRAGSL
jgi:ABC-2 type transport system permease protein